MVERSTKTAGLAVLVTAAALALAACGGPAAARVASLGGDAVHGRGATTTTSPRGNPTQLLDEWASCMRRHGDPDQADPTIDANGDINITWDPSITGGYNGTNKGGQGNSGPGQYCRAYLDAAQHALGGDQQPAGTDQASLERVARCMRANGIADFPDPVNGTLSFNVGAGGDLNPNNPAFQSAAKVCTRRTRVPLPGSGSKPPPGIIKLNGGGPLS